MRLKDALIARALAPDEKKAEGLILAGQVLVNDTPVTKPGATITENDFFEQLSQKVEQIRAIRRSSGDDE